MKKKLIVTILATSFLLTTPVYAKDFIYEDDIYSMCEEICKPYKVSPELVQSLIYTESRYDKEATNGSCKGLAQISEGCHKDRMKRLGVEDIYNPYDNILVATDYLAELFEEYEDVGLVLDKYNGRRNAQSLYKSGKMSSYANEILERARVLEEEHGKAEENDNTAY